MKEQLTFESVCDMLKAHEPFTLSRIGDGEWKCINRSDGANCDGHEYFDAMGDELRAILKKPQRYYMASHLLSTDADRAEVEKYIKDNDIQIDWNCTSGIFHEAIARGEIDKFVESLQGHSIILVGPKYLSEMGELDVFTHVEVSEKNCYLEGDEVLNWLNGMQSTHTVLFCASMAANCWIDKIYDKFHTVIDVGCVFDYYVKRGTRSFIRKKLAAENG